MSFSMDSLLRKIDEWARLRELTKVSKELFRWVARDFLKFCADRGLTPSKESALSYLSWLGVSNKLWYWKMLRKCFEIWNLEWFTPTEEAKYKPKPPERVNRVIVSLDEFNRLYEVADEMWLKIALRIAAETGARRLQIAMMRREHFNPDERTLYIPPIKRSLDRVEILSEELATMLIQYLASRRDRLPYLLVDEKGRPLTVEKMNAEMASLKKKAGLNVKHLGWHSLRRSWATWLYQEGMRELEIQRLGGWKSPHMVSIYVGLTPSETLKKEIQLHPLKRLGNQA